METISKIVRLLEQENEDLKSEIGRMKEFYGNDYKPMRCQECIHFCQHYGKSGNHYFKIADGHCKAGKRIKKRRAEDERCRYFE